MLIADLTIAVITNPNDAAIHDIHAMGAKLFPEKGIFETEDRFRECLENNTNADLQKAYGIGHEVWIVIKQQDVIVAAHNMLLVPTPSGSIEGCDGFAWWIYTFVDPAHRNKGIASMLKTVIDDYTMDYLSQANNRTCSNFIRLCEQNDPLQMTPAEFVDDVSSSGTNGFDRLLMAQIYVGFRRYDGHYMQPPLKGCATSSDHLMLQIAPSNPEMIVTPAQLQKALSTFFAISVLGGDPDGNAIAKNVLANIKAPIVLHDDRQTLTEKKQKTQKLLELLEQKGSLHSNTQSIGVLLNEYYSSLFAFEQITSLQA